jgi:hypothetical protein
MTRKEVAAAYARSLVKPDPKRPGVTMDGICGTITQMMECAAHMEEGHAEHWRRGMAALSMRLAAQAKAMRKRVVAMRREVREEMTASGRIQGHTGGA